MGFRKKSKSRFLGGIKVRRINVILMLASCCYTVLIFFSAEIIKSKYDTILYSMKDYSECNKAIYELRDASDYLTNQARLFSVKQDPEYMHNYFHEMNDLKRREFAIEILELSHEGDQADLNLKKALDDSVLLAEQEFYAMRLVCEAIHLEKSLYPAEIETVVLSEDDEKLSDNNKIERARMIIFDTDYLAAKEKIITYANKSLSYLINNYISEEEVNNSSIQTYFFHQVMFLAILLVLNIALYFIILTAILFPLFKHLDSIQNGSKMALKGAYEIRYIAAAYNTLCDKNAVAASKLKHKAEHDSLTGLINRNAFDEIKFTLEGIKEEIAYVLIDVDFFKKVNDEYGHSTGDAVLVKIAEMLKDQFRVTDYVARVGGDEFAVIMTKIGASPKNVIQKKIEDLNNQLQNSDDGLPMVTLSVGIAFSDYGYTDELAEYADKALYTVKRTGRCNCSFYEDNK